jgi:acyl-CoA dehydrogenase
VASSDATDMQLTAVVEDDFVALDGRNWWTTGIEHPDCDVLVVGLAERALHLACEHGLARTAFGKHRAVR